MSTAVFNEIRMFLSTPVANVRASLEAARGLERRAALMPQSPQLADVRTLVQHLSQAGEEASHRADALDVLDRIEAGRAEAHAFSGSTISAIPYRGPRPPLDLPSRQVGETLRILLEGGRNRRFPLSEMLASAVVHGGIPIARAVQWTSLHSIRGGLEALRGGLKGIVRDLEGRGTAASEFLEKTEGRFPPLYFARPQMKRILSLLRQDRLHDIPQELQRIGADMDLFLAPIFFELAEFLEGRTPHVSIDSFISMLQTRLAALESGSFDNDPRYFSPEIYHSINTRDFREYSGALFGEDPLHWVGVELQPGETALGRLLRDLPRGAVVADWGGGAGVFGMKLKEWRRDLRVFVNDLSSFKDILWMERDAQLIHRLSASGIEFLTGDALSTQLPEGVEADINISVLLTPYLPDPVRLITQLYNQTKPGGIVLMTLPPAMFDVSMADSHPLLSIQGLMHDLWSYGVQARLLHQRKTLLLRRPDRRRLSPTARLVRSHRVSRARPFPYEVFYWPQERPKGRWVELR